MYQSGSRIRDTLTAGVASDRTELCRCLTGQWDTALYEQVLAERHQLEQVPGTGCDAIRAGAAFLGVHLRKTICIHVNGVERAGDFAISEAKATPGTAFSAARYHCCGTAAFKAAVFCNLVCLQAATIAAQS